MNHSPTVFQTWDRKRICIVIAVALLYGIWFNFIDSLGFCAVKLKETCNEECQVASIGQQFRRDTEDSGDSGDSVYQPWNIIGHLIPGMILLWWYTPKKFELFVAGALISSIVMDSPIWGVTRLAHNLPLWYMDENDKNFVNTCNIVNWILYYYNPIGDYPVWKTESGLPTAAILFWSIIGRGVAAALLIWWHAKQDKENKDFSLVKLMFRGRTHST